MRVMVFVPGDTQSEAGVMPKQELIAQMMKFNEELVKAGVMLAGDGLTPTAKAKRVRFNGTQRTVIDGPFTESKELVAGYWIWQVKSVEEAIEWLKRAPFDGGVEVTLRPIFDPDDFGKELTPELRAKQAQLAAEISPAEPVSATHQTIEAVWRIECARLIGGLVRVVRDVGLAEDLAQEALVAALERWPTDGIPDNPGAWLMAAAKNRAIDQARRKQMLDRQHGALLDVAAGATEKPELEVAIDENVGDDLLRLVLVACHPVLSTEARAALTLKLLGGLTTLELSRAFLVPEPTIAQRIVRAKRTLAEAKVPFEVPRGEELTARVPSVLEVIYLIFNEGYAATAGEAWLRQDLCEDAMRLGRMLAALVPGEAEVQGLLALMELQASRARARVGPTGEPILLLDQDRARWDQLLLNRGLAALARAEALAQPLGPYTLQAAIAACHARARTADATDWKKIVALYDALAELTHSPVVELNRAVAVSMAFGPAAGLEIIEALAEEPALRAYHLLPSVRADLLLKLGRKEEARADLERAAGLAQNAREKALLLARAQALQNCA